ncbi:MAG: histone deacetylase, partial [bacterium]
MPLPDNHRFPMAKYAMLHHALVAEGILQPEELVPAEPATRAQVTVAHTPEYFDAFVDGSLAPEVIREIGIPWSPEF